MNLIVCRLSRILKVKIDLVLNYLKKEGKTSLRPYRAANVEKIIQANRIAKARGVESKIVSEIA